MEIAKRRTKTARGFSPPPCLPARSAFAAASSAVFFFSSCVNWVITKITHTHKKKIRSLRGGFHVPCQFGVTRFICTRLLSFFPGHSCYYMYFYHILKHTNIYNADVNINRLNVCRGSGVPCQLSDSLFSGERLLFSSPLLSPPPLLFSLLLLQPRPVSVLKLHQSQLAVQSPTL